MNRWRMFFMSAMFLSGTLTAADLVKEGMPGCEIIVSSDAPPGEITAANELQHWIKEISGAELPRLTTAGSEKNLKIYIGKKSGAEKFPQDAAKIANSDGFVIRQQGDNVYIFGDRPRGTIYGVATFLEDNTDIIWARPNVEFGTVFSKQTNIPLTKADRLEKPFFELRAWNVCSLRGHQPTGIWLARNKGNLADQIYPANYDMLTEWGGGHGMPKLPPFTEHPEYYFFNSQQNQRINKGYCSSNPAVPQLLGEKLAEYFNEPKNRRDIAWIGMADSWEVCSCENCQQPIKLSDGSEVKMQDPRSSVDPYFFSTRHYMMLNTIVDIFSKQHPDLTVMTFAYIYGAEVPAVDVNPNLLVLFAPYPTRNESISLLDPRQDKMWRERFEKWLKKTKNLGFYEYYWPSFRPIITPAAANLKALADAGGKGCISELAPDIEKPGEGSPGLLSWNWDTGAINAWVLTRLYWNPYADPAALKAEFIERTFKEAAPGMKKYFAIFDEIERDPEFKIFTNCHSSEGTIYNEYLVKRGKEQLAKQALQEAESAVKNPNAAKMVQAYKSRFEAIGKSLNRNFIPNVPESSSEWKSFESPQWEKAALMDKFQRTLRGNQSKEPTEATAVRIMHDAKNLYIKYHAADRDVAAAKFASPGTMQKFLLGDRGEILLNIERYGSIYLVFDGNGNLYGAKNFDKSLFKFNGEIVARKTSEGWECVISIPLSDIGLDLNSEKPQKVTTYLKRIYQNKLPLSEESSFNGGTFLRHNYELIFQL